MTDLVVRAQLSMLAETLGVEPERLGHLERLGSGQLRALRERISDKLFDEQAAMFARLSRLAPLVPNQVVAKVAEAVVPPLAAGRAAGALGMAHPDRATGVLSDLSPRYMADCAPHLDRRTIHLLAPRVAVGVLVPVANELMRRRAYVTASRFLDDAGVDLVVAFERGIPDKAGLLHTTSLVESTEQLNRIVRALDPERLAVIVREAVSGSPELLLAGLSVLSRLDTDMAARLGETLFAQLDDERLTWVLRTAIEGDGAAELLAVAAALRPDDLRRVGADPYLNRAGTVAALREAGLRRDRPAELDRLAEYLTDPAARRVLTGPADLTGPTAHTPAESPAQRS